MSLAAANTVHSANLQLFGQAVVCACAAKRDERIGGQPDITGTGGPHRK